MDYEIRDIIFCMFPKDMKGGYIDMGFLGNVLYEITKSLVDGYEAGKAEYERIGKIEDYANEHTNAVIEEEYSKILDALPELILIDPVKTWEDVENNHIAFKDYYKGLEKRRYELERELKKKFKEQAEKEITL